ncbi:RDD family protein [Aliikangiella coralliicola]|uniref:RDD family protein n=2 Tax=Aliikangiella coralliicola TaxID=2592383 RepID=A0A545U7W3_9GAMM|nr:RDD family protein [Aliikangiella coralliicola]
MPETIDYSTYTLSDLRDVLQHIDKDAYPERVAEIEALIAERSDVNAAIETSEYEDEFAKYSTFAPRFVASIIDGIITSVLSAMLMYVGTLLTPVIANEETLETVISYADAVQFTIYSVLLHGLFGQTLGKMVVRVKVVDAVTEKEINFQQAILRDCVPIFTLVFMLVSALFVTEDMFISEQSPQWFAYVLLGFGISYFIWHLLEIITMLFNKKRRALHDFIAGTVVVNI